MYSTGAIDFVMVRLQDLPTELLSKILEFEIGGWIIELWKSGNRALMAKMARGGVTRIRMRDIRLVPRALSWPKCFKEFHLTHLDFTAAYQSMFEPNASLKLANHLKELYRGIKHLRVSAPDALEAFFWYRPGDVTSSQLYARSLAAVSNNGGVDQCQFALLPNWNWSSVFEALESLSIGASWKSHIALTDASFGVLPSLLISLNIETPYHNRILRFDHLPPQLATFVLPSDHLLDTDLSTLPSSITNIGQAVGTSVAEYLLQVPSAIPNLEWLPTQELYDAYQFPFDLDTIEADEWPTKIASLAVVVDNLLPSFPPFLTDLACRSLSFPATHLKLLPSTLTSLQVLDIPDFEAIESSSQFPLRLSTLKFYGTGFVQLSDLFKLPRGLLVYEGPAPRNETLDYEQALENGLKSLDLPEERKLWNRIKPYLVGGAQGDMRVRADRYVEAVEKGGLYGLPLTLTKLIMKSSVSNDSIDLVLPPWTTTFEMSTVRLSSAEKFWSLLLPSVRSIYATSPALLLEEGSLSVPDNRPLVSMSTSTLNSLAITNWSPKGLSAAALDYFVASLPRTLKSLAFYQSGTMEAQTLTKLPPNLTSLHLRSIVIYEHNSWTYALPRSLKALYVPDLPIHADDWAHLPRNLLFLDIDTGPSSLADVIKYPNTLLRLEPKALKDLTVDQWKIACASYAPFYRIFEFSSAQIQETIDSHPKDLYVDVPSTHVMYTLLELFD